MEKTYHLCILEDQPLMAKCIARSARHAFSSLGLPEPDLQIFPDAVSAAQHLDPLPDLILLDILLTGPDGFAFLAELASYSDTASIPVIIISSLDFSGHDLSHYNVRATLHKDTMTPEDIITTIQETLGLEHSPSRKEPRAT